MTTSTIAERVAAGATWLDKNRPGWVDRIDLKTLDLGDPCRCVLGQEYADEPPDFPGQSGFSRGLNELAPLNIDRPEEDPADARYGFFSVCMTAGAEEDEYSDLTDAWRALILQRRAES